MKRQTRILAGTAIGLLMASTPLLAAPAMNVARPHESRAAAGAPLILAQAQNQDEDQERKKKKGEKAGRKAQDAEQAAPGQAQPEAAPRAEAKPERRQKQERAAQPQPARKAAEKAVEKAREPKPEAQAAQPDAKAAPKEAPRAAEQEAKPQRPAKASEPKPASEASEPKPAQEAVKPKPAREAAEPQTEKPFKAQNDNQKQPAAEGRAEGGAEGGKDKLRKYLQDKGQDDGATGEKAAQEPKAGKPKDRQAQNPSAEQPKAEQPKAEQPKAAQPEQTAKPAGQPQSEDQPATAEGSAKGSPEDRKDKLRKYLENKGEDGGTAGEKAAEQPKAGQPAQTAKPGEEAAPEGQPPEKQAKPVDRRKPANENQQAGDGGQKPTETVLPGNLKGGKERRQERVKEQADAEPLPDNAAPVFDSNKRGPGAEGRKDAERKGERRNDRARDDRQRRQEEEATADAPPPPQSDSAAQKVRLGADVIRSLLGGDREGDRFEPRSREERYEFQRRRHERRQNADVVKVYNDNRTIIEIDNRIYVDGSDSDRLVRRDDRVYYDELRHGRTREVVVRRNGVQVVTIRNRYGDVIRRSRVMPDGREVVLVYVPDDQIRQTDEWYDPARDLPPLRLTVPVSSYILEAATVEEPERYYEFFEQPPVAPIERIYSVEDVKRSARVRDIMPRVDLDTITFETGSAEIAESEVDELDAIAQAILKVLEDNPGETFLIEGHTDAVGSEESNLVLSDRRAAAVADALANVYEIPPENLVTQGYGEEYLKIDSDGDERANRRVAMRRITPLVAPVASAE